jgi:hypothetical protein
LEIFLAVGCWSRVLQIGLDGFILLVELRQVGDDVFDDVGVGERIDLGFLLGVGWDSACSSLSAHIHKTPDSASMPQLTPGVMRGRREDRHKHANVLTPSIFMAQLPQIPSLQLRRNVRVGSTSFLIRIRASNIIGPVLFKSNV